MRCESCGLGRCWAQSCDWMKCWPSGRLRARAPTLAEVVIGAVIPGVGMVTPVGAGVRAAALMIVVAAAVAGSGVAARRAALGWAGIAVMVALVGVAATLAVVG